MIEGNNIENIGNAPDNPIVDSNLSRKKAINSVPDNRRKFTNKLEQERYKNILERQQMVPVVYVGMDGKFHKGQIIVDQDLVDDIKNIFQEILDENILAKQSGKDWVFKFNKIIPIADDKYHWDDESSMGDDNSSGFNYRFIVDTNKLSSHAFGMAFDANPEKNPCLKIGKDPEPKNGKYEPLVNKNTTLTPEHKIVKIFQKYGFKWGGEWKSLKDYMHFEKFLPTHDYIAYLIDKLPEFNNIDDLIERINVLIKNTKTTEHKKTLDAFIRTQAVADILILKIGAERYIEFYDRITEYAKTI